VALAYARFSEAVALMSSTASLDRGLMEHLKGNGILSIINSLELSQREMALTALVRQNIHDWAP
jgi:hypothetical protein